jgi:hypothetical protein
MVASKVVCVDDIARQSFPNRTRAARHPDDSLAILGFDETLDARPAFYLLR